MTRPLVLTPRLAFGALAALAVMVGSLGPWRTVGPLQVSGTALTGDADLMVAGAVVALVLVVLDRATWAVLVIGAAVAAAAIYDVDGVTSVVVLGQRAAVGWGLVLVIAGSVALVVWAATDLWAMRRVRG